MKLLVIVLLLLSLEYTTQIISGAAQSHVTCSRNYDKIGCYKDKTKPLPVQLITDRDIHSPNFSGTLIDWQNWAAYIHGLTCRCAAKAKKLNYKVFGLQNFGECWSGPGVEKNYSRDSASTECYTHPCDVNKPQECVGLPGSNYIYRVKDEPCESGPCKNGGVCKTGSPHGFFCNCPSNFAGSVCENDVNECLAHPCKNNGVCKNTFGGFECQCQPGYQGKFCEKSCITSVVDLCVVVDGSGSVGNDNYMAIKRYLLLLAEQLQVSPSGAHIAMIYYSQTPHFQIKFTDAHLQYDVMFKLSILRLPFPDGETRTDLALKLASDNVFTPGGGDRSSVPNVMLLFTDGEHGKGTGSMKEGLKSLKNRGVRIIAVGIDKSADRKALEEITGNSHNVFIEEDVEKIPISTLAKAIESSC